MGNPVSTAMGVGFGLFGLLILSLAFVRKNKMRGMLAALFFFASFDSCSKDSDVKPQEETACKYYRVQAIDKSTGTASTTSTVVRK